jgi:hypothetical protein
MSLRVILILMLSPMSQKSTVRIRAGICVVIYLFHCSPHSAQWNEAYDFHGKRVALISSGSTAVQILPKLQPSLSQLGAYIRNQMWVSPRFGVDYILSRNPELLDRNFVLTEELWTQFETDDTFYAEYRCGLETSMNSIHGFTLVGHPNYVPYFGNDFCKVQPDIFRGGKCQVNGTASQSEKHVARWVRISETMNTGKYEI